MVVNPTNQTMAVDNDETTSLKAKGAIMSMMIQEGKLS